MQKYVLGALEKRIITHFVNNVIDVEKSHREAVRKAVHSDYKSVYEAITRLCKKGLVEAKEKALSKRGKSINLYGLTLKGLDKALRMDMFAPRKGYDVLIRNKISLPLFKVKEKMGFTFQVVEPIIKSFDLEKFRELTLAFMKYYPEDYFSGLKEFSETDPDLNIRLYVTTCLLFIRLFNSGKLVEAPDPIPTLVAEIEKPFNLDLLKGILKPS